MNLHLKKINLLLLLIIYVVFSSCLSTKDVKYMQPSESLVINEEGLVPYNIQEYRVTKNDIFELNVVTTPKGDAAQFYSTLNASQTIKTTGVDNTAFYFGGLKVDSQGNINILGIGDIKAEGRTVEDITQEIQTRVNKNFVIGKAEARLNLNGIKYYLLGDVETTGMTGEKISHTQTLNIMEAIAQNGGLNRTVDRKNVRIQRRYPEGIKNVTLDLTREDIMNSPYYWIQNGDLIYLSTTRKSLLGFGNTPLQTIITGVSAITTALSVYLILSKL